MGLCVLILSSAHPAHAGFFIKRSLHATVALPDTVHEAATFPTAIHPEHKKPKSAFLAYLAAGLGVLGIAIMSIHTTPIIILLGLVAGISGKTGLKKIKHDKFLKALCYIGIVLGAILVIFGTIPLLFLV